MLTLIAGVISGILAWLGNSLLIKQYGERRTALWFAPVLEEAAKTLLAAVLGGSIFYTHLIFGALEGILDIRNGVRGFSAAVYSLLTHSVFGVVTAAALMVSHNLILATATAMAVHILWNRRIIKK